MITDSSDDSETASSASRPAWCGRAPRAANVARGVTARTRASLRPLLFAIAPDTAHALGHGGARAGRAPGAAARARPRRWRRRATRASSSGRWGWTFPSPVGLAGGFDKNAHRPRALAALGFGHVELGTVTALAQAANPKPNMFRLPADRALINRLGFPNDGAARVAARIARGAGAVRGSHRRLDRQVARGGGRRSRGRRRRTTWRRFDAVRAVADFVVVNVSSPNTAGPARDAGRTSRRTRCSRRSRESAARPRGRPCSSRSRLTSTTRRSRTLLSRGGGGGARGGGRDEHDDRPRRARDGSEGRRGHRRGRSQRRAR